MEERKENPLDLRGTDLKTLIVKKSSFISLSPKSCTYLCLNHGGPLGPEGANRVEDVHHPLVLHPLQHDRQRDEHPRSAHTGAETKGMKTMDTGTGGRTVSSSVTPNMRKMSKLLCASNYRHVATKTLANTDVVLNCHNLSFNTGLFRGQ